MITKQETIFIKGIALILVLFGHCFPPFLPFHEFYVPIKQFLGQVGVDLFLVLSGYGVAFTSFKELFSPLSFLLRRVIKLWPVYVFTMVFYCIVSIIFFQEEISFEAFISNLLWVQVFFNTQNEIYSASHFFSALLTAYLLFSTVLVTKSMTLRLTIYLIVLGVFQGICLLHYGRFLFTDYLASFSLGIALVFKKEGVGPIKLLVFLLLGYVYCLADIEDLSTALVGILFFVVSVKCIRSEILESRAGSFIFIGYYSYIIYLGHNFFLWKWPNILERTGSVPLTGFIIVIATLVWMSLLFWVDKRINKWMVSPLLETVTSRQNYSVNKLFRQ